MSEKVKVPVWFDQWLSDHDNTNRIELIKAIINNANEKISLIVNDKAHPVADQDKLKFISAILNGYEVEEQRFVLLMEGTAITYSGGKPYAKIYASRMADGRWNTFTVFDSTGETMFDKKLFVTESDLENAPAWVKAITPVPVDSSKGIDTGE